MDKPGWIRARMAMQWNAGTVFLLPLVITLDLLFLLLYHL